MPEEGPTALLQQLVGRPTAERDTDRAHVAGRLRVGGRRFAPSRRPRPRSGCWPSRALGPAAVAGIHRRDSVARRQRSAGGRQPPVRAVAVAHGPTRSGGRSARSPPRPRARRSRSTSIGSWHVAEQLRPDAPIDDVAEQLFKADLLPSWHDEWLAMARERLRQIRLTALEHLAERRLADGESIGATAETSALRCGPLSERSHWCSGALTSPTVTAASANSSSTAAAGRKSRPVAVRAFRRPHGPAAQRATDEPNGHRCRRGGSSTRSAPTRGRRASAPTRGRRASATARCAAAPP